MTAIKNNNTIIIRNTERQSENVFFNKIVIAFENNRNILIKNKITIKRCDSSTNI